MSNWQNIINVGSVTETKKEILLRNKMYRDDWLDVLEKELQAQFPKEWDDPKFKLLATTELNILKKIINTVAKVYKKDPTRQAITETANNEADTVENMIDENYQKAINESNIDQVMRTAEKYNELDNQVLLKVVYRNNKINYDMFTFDNVEVYTDEENSLMPVCIVYYNDYSIPNPWSKRGSSTSGYQLDKYKKGYVWYLDGRDTDPQTGDVTYNECWMQEIEGVERRPVGDPVLVEYASEPKKAFLPFILMTNSYRFDDLIDYTTGNDMIDANINIGVAMTLLNQMFKNNSFKTLGFIVESESDLPESFFMSPASGIGIPSRSGGGSSIENIDMQATYDKFYDTVKKRASFIASQYGVSIKDTEGSGSASSGFAIVVSNLDLIEHREEMTSLYRGFEREIFEKTRKVYNYFNDSDSEKISEDATFQIDYVEEVFPVPTNEQSEKDTTDLQNNTTNPIEIIMRDNPDITIEQATAKYEANKTINGADRVTPQTPTQPSEI